MTKYIYYTPKFTPTDPQILKTANSKCNHILGLKVLGSLWKRGLFPSDLENHFLMTWLAYENGNASRLSKTLGLHRNTLIFQFREKANSPSTIKLRKLWFKICSLSGKKSFSQKVFEFYFRAFTKPPLKKFENEGLVNLWLMGFPRKVVRLHFILWLFKRGRSLKEVSRILRLNPRSIHRFRLQATQPGSPVAKWLKPLKPTKKDWYPLGFGGRRKGK